MKNTLQCVRASNDRALAEAIALFLAIRYGDVAHVRALLRGRAPLAR